MIFSFGGPKHFENNLPLENSPLWESKNLARYIHHCDMCLGIVNMSMVFRCLDTTTRSPLIHP